MWDINSNLVLKRQYYIFFGIFLASLFITYANEAFGQGQRITEAEVNIQELFLKANADKLSGRNDAAKTAYLHVIDKDPDNDASFYELARIHFHENQYAQAGRYIGKAVKFAPDNEWYRFLQADIYEKESSYEAAAEVYEHLRTLFPDKREYYYEEAFQLIKAGNYKEAINVYSKLEKQIGFDENLVRRKQAAHIALGDGKSAVKDLESWRKMFPKSVVIHQMLADLYLTQGDIPRAHKTYEELLTIDPSNGKARLALSEKYFAAQNYKKYLGAIEAVLSDSDVNIDVKIGKLLPFVALISKENGELDRKILSSAKLLTKVHPNSAKATSLYADLLYNSGDKSTAKQIFEETIELEKGVFSVWEQLMRIYEETDDLNALLALTDQAFEFFPNKAVVHYFNGIAHAGLGQSETALASFENTLAMSRKHPLLQLDVYHRLGDVLFKMGKYDKAQKNLGKAVELGGDKIGALMELYGDVEYKLGNIDAAVEYWTQAKNLGITSEKLTQKIERKTWIE